MYERVQAQQRVKAQRVQVVVPVQFGCISRAISGAFLLNLFNEQ